MKSALRGFSLLPLFLVAACGSNTGNGSTVNGACGASSTGKLVVTVSGLPAGVNAHVNLVNGSNQQIVTQTTTLDSVASGTYTVSADIVTQADPIVRTAFKGTVSVTTAQVCDGETANIDVTYAAIPTSNKIWWGNQDGQSATLGYASANLAATGSPAADVEASTDNAVAGEFDSEGNLWAIDGVSKSVKRFTADSLSSSGTKTADIEITYDAFTGGVPGPATLTFDSKGNLYVGIAFSKTIVRFDHESLGATASLTPNATIAVPDVPSSIAFDGSGNLWVDYNGTFAKLSPADLSGSGDKTVTPAVQVVSDVLTVSGGISIDESGGLWFAYTAGKFAKLSASQLAASSTSATPSVIVSSSSVAYALNPALYPAPKALPLYAAVQN